jgi:hypothetical protein
MPALMADVNAEGFVRALVSILEGPTWQEVWVALDTGLVTLADRGLARTSPDDVLWRACQRDGIILVTINRNATGADSLEQVIRAENRADSLPVLTLARPERILIDRPYAERAAERLLEILFELENYLGAGRLYIP